MTTESASLAVGVSSAMGAVLLQANPAPAASLMVPVMSGIIGFAASYGILKASVAALGREIKTIRDDQRMFQQSQQSLLQEALERISRIEGRLEDRRGTPRD